MAGRPLGRWTVIPAALGLVLALLSPTVSAADGDDGNAFELTRPLVDVAIIPRGAGLPPDLLTLDTANEIPGEARLAVLRRGSTGWTMLADSPRLFAGLAGDLASPWLVDLGGGRFAVMASSQSDPGSAAVGVRVDTRVAPPTIEIGQPMGFDGWAAYSGAADVDGDGLTDLVVASMSQGDDSGRCSDTNVHVVSGPLLDRVHPARTIKLKGVTAVRLGGVASGEFDGRPGADLVAHAFDTCSANPDGPEPHHVVAIRLTDGSVITDLPTPEADWPNVVALQPLVVDVDGDGRDEAIVSGAGGVNSIYDPTDHWKRLPLGDDDAPPLTVTDGSAGRPGTVTWVSPLSLPSAAAILTASIARVRGVLTQVKTAITDLPPLDPAASSAALSRLRFVVQAQLPTISWTGDLDGDGCPELVLPMVVIRCVGSGAAVPGPTWLSARPLADVGTPGSPSLLVANGLDWFPYGDGPPPPSPTASAAGWWRAGSGETFSLAEVTLRPDAAVSPVAAPVINALTDRAGWTEFQAPVGSRLLWRVTPLAAAAPPPDPVMTMEEFLGREPQELEYVRMLPARAAATGSATATVPFALVDESTLSGLQTDRWSVTAVALDASGQPSAVSGAIVVYDQTAPEITVDTPSVSPPWPFDAKITGRSEPGVTVRSGDGAPVTVGPSGTFEIPAKFAPWPQTIEVVATDASGNATPATASIMGGVDLRPLPWPAMAAVVIIVAVALSSLRGTRRVRDIAPVVASGEDGNDLVIEELEPGSTYRPD